MAELRRDDPLFDRVLPIHINFGGTSQNLPSNLVFRILRGTQPGQALGQSEAVYHFEVTDDRDPYFLYFFEVGESDFPQFKREQSILVEFHAVPLKLIELLEHCLRSSGMLEPPIETVATPNQTSLQSSSAFLQSSHLPLTSTYSAELDTSSGIFSIVEANQFNKLVHIKVPLKLGDDSAIKLYLASRLALALSQSRRLRGEVSTHERRREDDAVLLEQQRVELGDLRMQRNADLQSLRAQHSQELSNMQRQHLETVEEMRVKHDEVTSQLKRQLEETQATLSERSLALQRRVADLEHDRSQLDFKCQDLSRLLAAAEADRDRLLKECDDLHARRRALEEERTSLLRDIAKLDSRIEGLTSQLSERDASMQKSLQLQRAAEEARQATEERLRLELLRGEEAAAQCAALQSEAERFQALATRLQTDNRGLKDRFRDKNEVLRKQEVVVTELRGRLSDTEAHLARETEAKRKALQDIDLLQLQLSGAQEQLEKALQVNQESKNVIGYMSTEINRMKLGQRVAAEPALHSSPAAHQPGKAVYTPKTAAGSSGATPDTALRRFSTPLNPASSSAFANSAAYTGSPSAATPPTYAGSGSSSYLERGARRLGLDQDLRLAVAELQLDAASSPSSEEASLSQRPKATSALGLRRDVDLDQLDYYKTAAASVK